jgi:hypothetical protein
MSNSTPLEKGHRPTSLELHTGVLLPNLKNAFSAKKSE